MRSKIKDSLQYRVAFTGQVSARYGFNTGIVSMANLDGTINAVTGFLMIVEENGDLSAWTLKELTQKYDRLLQTAWANVNPPLFTLILQTYCAYKRGELAW
jgi:hypothetical protein